MFEINPQHCINITDKLLYNIYMLLHQEGIKEDTKMLHCKNCNEEFENKGLLLAHYRKCKKEVL